MKYNVSQMDATSFSGLLREANTFMNGGLGYGLLVVFWLVSMATLSSYPNVDALKASTYITWIASILFSVFEVVDPTVPLAIFMGVAGMAAFQYFRQ